MNTALILLFFVTIATASQVGSPKRAGELVIIKEDDWTQILTGEWMIEFHAPWCPACRALQPEWKKFASWSTDLGIQVGAVDVTLNPGLSGRFLVTALPTIYHVKDGVFRLFKGSRDMNTFTDFIDSKKWESIEAVNSWTAPQSIQMSLVSNLFKVSMVLRSVHTQLVDDYGIPYWGSYVAFALCTIIIGAVLGLMIVFFIDLIWPSSGVPSDKDAKNKKQPKAVNFKDEDNVKDDSVAEDSEGPAAETSAVAGDSSANSSPPRTPDLRKRRPRKD